MRCFGVARVRCLQGNDVLTPLPLLRNYIHHSTVADDPTLTVLSPGRQHKDSGLSLDQRHLTHGEGGLTTGHSSLEVFELQRRSSGAATLSQYSSCLFVFTAGLNVEVFIRHAVNAKSLSTIFRVSGCGDADITPALRCQVATSSSRASCSPLFRPHSSGLPNRPPLLFFESFFPYLVFFIYRSWLILPFRLRGIPYQSVPFKFFLFRVNGHS